MKNQTNWLQRAVRVLPVVLASGILFASCSKDDDDKEEVDNRPYTVTGNASGTQMVPAVEGEGTGTLNGTYSPATREFIYTSSWSNLSGAPTAASFYSGASGANGTAVGTPWDLGTEPGNSGSITDTLMLTQEQGTELLGGNWYYTFGTTDNPNGEVRGQLSATR
ncbi:MAG TPA: CHRD domain-containing protein [Flavihumibacter sp.]